MTFTWRMQFQPFSMCNYFENVSPQWGLNSRPLVYKTSALATELWRQLAYWRPVPSVTCAYSSTNRYTLQDLFQSIDQSTYSSHLHPWDGQQSSYLHCNLHETIIFDIDYTVWSHMAMASIYGMVLIYMLAAIQWLMMRSNLALQNSANLTLL